MFLHSKGYEDVEHEGECCGTCKQNACIYTAPDNTTHFLKVQSQTFLYTFSSPDNLSALFFDPHVAFFFFFIGWREHQLPVWKCDLSSSQWHVYDREDHAKLPWHWSRKLCDREFNILSKSWCICCLYFFLAIATF